MGENSRIAWCDHTFNPWIGCSHVHAGCQNCYAERQQGRFGVHWGPRGTRRKTSEAYWKQPLKWEREAAKQKALHERHPELEPWVPPKVFVGSLMDFFEDWTDAVQDHHGADLSAYQTIPDLRLDACRIFDQTPHVDYLLCTKRPENIWRMLMPWLRDRAGAGWESPDDAWRACLPVPNVWLLYSASDQATLDAGLHHLLRCRNLVPVLGLSLEPLVGPLVIPSEVLQVLDWVIIGSEQLASHKPGRFADGYEAAARLIIQQCAAAGVAAFHKQTPTGAFVSDNPADWPEDIRVRQWPR